MTSLKIISADLDNLAQALEDAPNKVIKPIRASVKRGAQNIKTDAQNRARGLPHAPDYPQAITYDSHETPFGAWAEIGPDKNRRQGSLGNLIEYGSVNNPGGRPHMRPAGEAEEPKLAQALENVAARILGGLR